MEVVPTVPWLQMPSILMGLPSFWESPVTKVTFIRSFNWCAQSIHYSLALSLYNISCFINHFKAVFRLEGSPYARLPTDFTHIDVGVPITDIFYYLIQVQRLPAFQGFSGKVTIILFRSYDRSGLIIILAFILELLMHHYIFCLSLSSSQHICSHLQQMLTGLLILTYSIIKSLLIWNLTTLNISFALFKILHLDVLCLPHSIMYGISGLFTLGANHGFAATTTSEKWMTCREGVFRQLISSLQFYVSKTWLPSIEVRPADLD